MAGQQLKAQDARRAALRKFGSVIPAADAVREFAENMGASVYGERGRRIFCGFPDGSVLRFSVGIEYTPWEAQRLEAGHITPAKIVAGRFTAFSLDL